MAPPANKIYRAAALERLSSPEQLDQFVGLTSPLGWLSALALVALVALAIVWSILGRLPVSVAGSGILVIREGQLFDAMASSTGTLISVADIGTLVKKGDVVARLDDKASKANITHAQAVIRERKAELATVERSYDEQMASKHQNTIAQKANLNEIIRTAQRRSAFYRDYLQKEAAIVAKGFISQRTYEDTRHNMELAEHEEGQARSDLLRLDAEEIDLKTRRDHDVLIAQQAVNEAQRRLDELMIDLDQGTEVTSPLGGIVTEVKTSPGAVVTPGKPIVSIEPSGKGLQLLLYIPPQFGKAVRPGMEVRIAPATVKRQEFGTLVGRVLTVSDFPMTQEGMISALQNQQLVQELMREGPPYAARVELVAEADSPSGYRWSGGRGPPVRLSSGTTAAAEITITRKAPIALLLPFLKDAAGLGS